MATCQAGIPQKIRAPGWTAESGIGRPSCRWASAEWLSCTPAACQARIVNPEQSYPYGPAPPNTYGLPSCAYAKASAAAAPEPLGTGGAAPPSDGCDASTRTRGADRETLGAARY